MVLSTPILTELIQEILAELHGDSHTIRQTSLVASQQLLFSKIHIIFNSHRGRDDYERAARLLSTFEARSEFILCVQELYLELEGMWAMADSATILPVILEKFQNLEVLTLNAPCLHEGRFSLFALPNLTEVSLIKTSWLPAHPILECLPRLTRLVLRNPSFSLEFGGDKTWEGTASALQRLGERSRGYRLEVLDIDRESAYTHPDLLGVLVNARSGRGSLFSWG